MTQTNQNINPSTNKPVIDIILPLFNEEKILPEFLATLSPILTAQKHVQFHIIAVDDGSSDTSAQLIETWAKKQSTDESKLKNFSCTLITFSRNFGKEMAIKAGIDNAIGQASIIMDCDLEDPVNLIPELIHHWLDGYNIVYTTRELRKERWHKRLSAWLFYKCINALSSIDIYQNAGDYRLFDQKVIAALKQYKERTRFSKGLFNMVGFKSMSVPYTRIQTKGRQSKWTYFKLWKYALDGIFSFSVIPLKTWSYLGFLCSLFSAGYLIFIVSRTLMQGVDVPGYASLVAIMLFFNGILLISVGILGEYIARIFEEVKQRPHYIIEEKIDI